MIGDLVAPSDRIDERDQLLDLITNLDPFGLSFATEVRLIVLIDEAMNLLLFHREYSI